MKTTARKKSRTADCPTLENDAFNYSKKDAPPAAIVKRGRSRPRKYPLPVQKKKRERKQDTRKNHHKKSSKVESKSVYNNKKRKRSKERHQTSKSSKRSSSSSSSSSSTDSSSARSKERHQTSRDLSQMAEDLGIYAIVVTRITKNSTPSELRASINILIERRKTNYNLNLMPKITKAIREYQRQLKLRTVSEIPQLRDPTRQARLLKARLRRTKLHKARLLKKSKMKNRFLPKEKSEKLDTKQKAPVVRSREQRTKEEAHVVTKGLASRRERKIPTRYMSAKL